MRVLVVDVGGSHVKLWLSDREGKRKFDSGPDLTPARMTAEAMRVSEDWPFDAVALGVPCRVVEGKLVTNPEHLGPGWVDFDFSAAFGKPVRIINDANLQALGCYRGGRMLFVGLGTHVGSALVVHNTVVSLDVGVLLNDEGEEIWQSINKKSLKKIGQQKWEKRVNNILPRLQKATFADEVVIGGGQSDLLTELPHGMRRGSNADVRLGGERLWEEAPPQPEHIPGWRIL